MITDRFIQRLREVVDADGLLPAGTSVVVGVSGGCDSLALMHGLAAVNEAADAGWRVHVAHLNHMLRGDASDADADFVREQAEALGLPYTVEVEDVAAQAGGGRGLEEVARDRRYAFFQRVALRTGSPVVAIGHQADDNAETVLHRIVRGTGLRGLGGMPASREIAPGSGIRLVRPLLNFRRAELTAFLAERGVSFREDESNADERFTRNRIRGTVLPLLRESVNPAVDDALLRLAEQARWVDSYLRETAQRVFEALVVRRTDRELVLNIHALTAKSLIVQAEVIRQAVLYFELGEQDLTFGHVRMVLELAAAGTSGKQLDLPGGLSVAKEYGRLRFSLPDREPRESIAPEVSVKLPGETILPVRRMRIQAEPIDADFGGLLSWKTSRPPNEEWLDWDQVHPPLVVRARRQGDRFWPLGGPGSKRISEFLSDEKVSPAERVRVAVLCDQLGPVWIIPYRIDERVKITRATRRVLKLTATPLSSG